MKPYEFGLRVGLQLEKRAEGERTWGGFGRDLLLGYGGLAGQVDPMKRGLVAHGLAYSNPFTGVPTAISDTGRHLYNGRYLSALGSVGEGALSFLPGLGLAGGFAARGAAKGLAAGGKALANAGMRQAGGALINTARAGTRGRLAVEGAQTAIGKGIQRVMPTVTPPVPAATGAAGWGAATRNAPANLRNFVATKPLQAASGGLGPLDPTTVGAMARGEHFMTPEGRAYTQQMQQMQQVPRAPMPVSQPQAPLPRPPKKFTNPRPMVNFQ